MDPRRLVRLPLVALAATVLVLGVLPSAQASPSRHGGFPEVVDLPDGFRPEGIAIRGTTAYFGSLADGDIYAADLRSGEGAVISEGPGTPSVGLKIDDRGRLFVAGGAAGEARVISARTGQVLATYEFTAEASFINDVVLTRRMAWFTDSANPVLYGLPLGRRGDLPDADEVVTLELGGEYVQQPGFNLNGITRTPDGRALLAVQTATGLLFRIDPESGEATEVDLGGALLTNGDGMLLLGRTLYVVQNRSNQVAVVELNRSGTRGQLVDTLNSDHFDVPTTVAAFGRWLYLPKARFSTPPTPTTTYTAVRIER